jgi:hypothetical protein
LHDGKHLAGTLFVSYEHVDQARPDGADARQRLRAVPADADSGRDLLLSHVFLLVLPRDIRQVELVGAVIAIRDSLPTHVVSFSYGATVMAALHPARFNVRAVHDPGAHVDVCAPMFRGRLH